MNITSENGTGSAKLSGKKIVDLVRDEIPHDSRGRCLDPQIQVACALRNWARHQIQDDTGDLHGISQQVVFLFFWILFYNFSVSLTF